MKPEHPLDPDDILWLRDERSPMAADAALVGDPSFSTREYEASSPVVFHYRDNGEGEQGLIAWYEPVNGHLSVDTYPAEMTGVERANQILSWMVEQEAVDVTASGRDDWERFCRLTLYEVREGADLPGTRIEDMLLDSGFRLDLETTAQVEAGVYYAEEPGPREAVVFDDEVQLYEYGPGPVPSLEELDELVLSRVSEEPEDEREALADPENDSYGRE